MNGIATTAKTADLLGYAVDNVAADFGLTVKA
jgi:hypothetical protein